MQSHCVKPVYQALAGTIRLARIAVVRVVVVQVTRSIAVPLIVRIGPVARPEANVRRTYSLRPWYVIVMVARNV